VSAISDSTRPRGAPAGSASVLDLLEEIDCEHPGGPTVRVTGGSFGPGEGHVSSYACPACVDDAVAVVSERYPDTAVTSLPGRLVAGEPRSGKRRVPAEVRQALAEGRVMVIDEPKAELPLFVGTVVCAASPVEEARARRWLDDLTAGALEHELTVHQVVAAVNALYEGGWPGFLADTTAGRSPWADDEEGDR
jgi:hypothetical protein